nr:25s rrna (adenine-n(1))-methyltransferase [Quercus suber]POF00886.1 25s rrna (adenine-n(1))-methyltransferase [Quercus suber]
MFAVKGWSVDASSLKPQTEPFKSAKAAAKEERQSPQDGEKTSRKRKRRDEASVADQAQDVGKMWERHVEGKKGSSEYKKEKLKTLKEKKKEMKAKKRKLAEETQTGPNAEAVGASKEGKGQDKQDAVGAAEVLEDNKTQSKDKRNTAKSSQKIQAQAVSPVLPHSSTAKLTPMQAAMRQKLVSARFRHLNQTLYTAPSKTALDLFAQNPEMFEDYHAGFRQQVVSWPENPVTNFIATLRARGRIAQPAKALKKKAEKDGRADLPRTQGTCIVADLGCGDAALAQTLTSSGDTTALKLQILSYDLHSPSPLVTRADISALPTAAGSVDVAIFCLALMGTNWISFVEEAYRILHWKGELWVAEIKSRFGRVGGHKSQRPAVVPHSVGSKRKQAALLKANARQARADEEVDELSTLRTEVDGVEPARPSEETDVSGFVQVLRRRGFVLKEGSTGLDLSNKMFVKMEFVKAAVPVKGPGVPEDDARTGKKEAAGERRFAKSKKKFVDGKAEGEEEVSTEDEGRVLQPCLYKIR